MREKRKKVKGNEKMRAKVKKKLKWESGVEYSWLNLTGNERKSRNKASLAWKKGSKNANWELKVRHHVRLKGKRLGGEGERGRIAIWNSFPCLKTVLIPTANWSFWWIIHLSDLDSVTFLFFIKKHNLLFWILTLSPSLSLSLSLSLFLSLFKKNIFF